MKSRLLMIVFSLTLLTSIAPAHAEVDKEKLKQEAISIVREFGGSLKPELKAAIQSGGPSHAVSVCAEAAPEIAQKLRNQTGWYVKRVSLKARNQQSAIPDAWEEQVLRQFDQRQANGESAAKMAFAEVVDGQFRFMKAQGVEAVCLKCHGAHIAPDVEAALSKKYPDDRARGYSLGQIRGAFSLAKEL